MGVGDFLHQISTRLASHPPRRSRHSVQQRAKHGCARIASSGGLPAQDPTSGNQIKFGNQLESQNSAIRAECHDSHSRSFYWALAGPARPHSRPALLRAPSTLSAPLAFELPSLIGSFLSSCTLRRQNPTVGYVTRVLHVTLPEETNVALKVGVMHTHASGTRSSISSPHQIWDIGGGVKPSSPLMATFLSGCQAVLAMYDSTSVEVGDEAHAIGSMH